jgi:hypothetical protein
MGGEKTMNNTVKNLAPAPEWGFDNDMATHYLADVTTSDGTTGQVAVAYGVPSSLQDQARRTGNISGMSEWYIPEMDCAVDPQLRGIEIADIASQLSEQQI